MVCAHYCAPYPKQPCVVHEVNMWCPCCMTSFVLQPSTKSSPSLMICLVTSPSGDWCDSMTDQP